MADPSFRITIEIDDAGGTSRTWADAGAFAQTIVEAWGDQWDQRSRPRAALVDVERVESQAGRQFEKERRRLRDEALVQIQHIAYDGGILGEEAESDDAIEGNGTDAVRALTAKLQRVCSIAEGCEPDGDWSPLVPDSQPDVTDGRDRMADETGFIPEALWPGGEGKPEFGLEQVYTVEIEGRNEGLYFFNDIGYRNAFATAVESEGARAVRGVKPVSGEAATKALIAAEVAKRMTPASSDRIDADCATVSASDAVSELRDLLAIANYTSDGLTDLRLEELGLVIEGGDPLEDQANGLLDGMCSEVKATTTFEVVPDIGGRARSLCFECDRITERRFEDAEVNNYEIRRVYWRHGSSGSAEIDLAGHDRLVAESFGHRVVPELAR